ncbi:uncharacterized protein L3040_007756 [Drepanopeziza brunnea f. sp. 'multigermtubi']|uniref:uncharacterized protein n=1 Tax=Drepanopeziza brunnea f. sp. 'multigermtubi' TaxID=698441 RepID=UPI0023843162|nr:hypothetical protein L3040_007756 [Drepanopeziza brunnea f. sp. 'multigermtubi']
MSSSHHKHSQPHVKHPSFGHLALSTSGPQDCALTGSALLNTPYFNKGAAFPAEERKKFKLTGLLPQHVSDLDTQVRRAYQQYSSRGDDLAKNTFMTSLAEQNAVLYYRLIKDHLKEMFSIIYTPTEGDAIQNYSRLFRRPEGCFLNINDVDRVYDDLAQWGSAEDIDYIVVTDGEEILGIGDQGVGGILISVAKLVLATLCAGIHPNRTLPVVLDCGTDNEELLNDELYLGLRQKRARGEEYDDFVDRILGCRMLVASSIVTDPKFLASTMMCKGLAGTLKPSFFQLFENHVTLAAIMAGLHVSNLKLSDMRMVVFGSGTAGTGIADQVRDAIATDSNISKEEAAKQIWCVDKPGLLLKSHGDRLTKAQIPYARQDSDWENKPHSNLLDVIKEVKPHVLIGTSTKPKAFTEEIVKEMASHVDRPIIFPLSNPTRLHEASPEDINQWSKGKALIATGSPSAPVQYEGRPYEVAECNNSTCFPGIGLGCVLSRSSLLSDKMLVAAVKALAAQSPALKNPDKGLLPDVENVREISVRIARAVIQQAVEEGLATEKDIPTCETELEEWIREQMWDPVYRPLHLVKSKGATKAAKGEAGMAGGKGAE